MRPYLVLGQVQTQWDGVSFAWASHAGPPGWNDPGAMSQLLRPPQSSAGVLWGRRFLRRSGGNLAEAPLSTDCERMYCDICKTENKYHIITVSFPKQ